MTAATVILTMSSPILVIIGLLSLAAWRDHRREAVVLADEHDGPGQGGDQRGAHARAPAAVRTAHRVAAQWAMAREFATMPATASPRASTRSTGALAAER